MSLESLFEGFHGRGVKKDEDKPLDLPPKLHRLGRVINIVYDSDKRDPGSPWGDGRQGVWKLFTHKHGRGVNLYSTHLLDGSSPSGGSSMRYPAQVAWLAKIVEIEMADGTIIEPRSMDLWVAKGGRVLMGLPRRYSRKPWQVLLWKGGNLRVEPRGIVD